MSQLSRSFLIFFVLSAAVYNFVYPEPLTAVGANSRRRRLGVFSPGRLRPVMSAAPAAWYAIATLLASMYYAEDLAMSSSCALRPSWSPLWALRAASYCFRPARAALLGVGVGAACCPSAQPWRLAFFCALALCDFRYFSGYGGHTNFVLLYTAAAMVLPDGFARCGVLRAVVAHQLGSAGVHKLRVGGRAWLVRSHTSP